jgi:glutamate/tyrosine decarboxylase-like PLP-dependent enzyme
MRTTPHQQAAIELHRPAVAVPAFGGTEAAMQGGRSRRRRCVARAKSEIRIGSRPGKMLRPGPWPLLPGV